MTRHSQNKPVCRKVRCCAKLTKTPLLRVINRLSCSFRVSKRAKCVGAYVGTPCFPMGLQCAPNQLLGSNEVGHETAYNRCRSLFLCPRAISMNICETCGCFCEVFSLPGRTDFNCAECNAHISMLVLLYRKWEIAKRDSELLTELEAQLVPVLHRFLKRSDHQAAGNAASLREHIN